MKRNNIGFYERYKKEQKQKKMEENFRKRLNISDDKTIVIENKTKMDKFLFYLKSLIEIILKTIIYISILVLSTIGATVLLNEALRVAFFEVMQTII